MEYEEIIDLLQQIKGVTFASIDTTTYPSPGIKKVCTNEQVLLFTNEGGSGYEAMVKRRLRRMGLDPDRFVLSDLSWGSRVPNTPLIYHKDRKGHERYYLQTIQNKPGISVYYIGDREAPDPERLGLGRSHSNQGLPRGHDVIVSTYRLEHIDAIRLLGEERKSGTLSIWGKNE